MGSTRLHGFCVCIAKCDSTATLVCGAADPNSTTAIMVVITSVQTRCPANATGQAVVSWSSADLSNSSQILLPQKLHQASVGRLIRHPVFDDQESLRSCYRRAESCRGG